MSIEKLMFSPVIGIINVENRIKVWGYYVEMNNVGYFFFETIKYCCYIYIIHFVIAFGIFVQLFL